MAEYTPHQKKIIERYYANQDSIMLEKLSELVGELYLAESDRKRDALWKRVDAAMRNLKVPTSIAAHILEKRDAKVLAANVKEWMDRAR